VQKAITAVPTAEGGEEIRVASFVRLLARALPLAVTIAAVPAVAQDYPTRPVTIVVGYTPGATSDLLARTVAERLNAAWGQSVIVDNRSGVGGNIAAAYVARAPADGYTLMVGTDAIMTSNVFLYKNTPFDPVKDFAPITNAGANIICLAVHVDLPVNSVAELIAYAKAHPGQLQYGSSGIGSPHHLAGELLRQKTGIDIVHVPYRGGGATINDLLGGHTRSPSSVSRPRFRISGAARSRSWRSWKGPATPPCRTSPPSARQWRALKCRPGSRSSRQRARRHRSWRDSMRRW
jgi:tripartite-type tricarboxylate transporter receptor subunit TctC